MMRLSLGSTSNWSEAFLMSVCEGFLPAEKRRRIARSSDEGRRKEMLLGEALLARALRVLYGWRLQSDGSEVPVCSEVPECPEVPVCSEAIERRLSPTGKPFLMVDGRPGPAFSISHSHGWVLVGVADDGAAAAADGAATAADVGIGVDIEKVRPLSASVLARFLTPAEMDMWAASGKPDDFSIECWTRRESELKYLGIGIAGLHPEAPLLPEGIAARNVEVVEGYRAAVCGRSDDDVVVERVEDL